ncbi:MAG: hypothetical protein ABIT36_08910, partial [Steroidobacteraceae bacterium]
MRQAITLGFKHGCATPVVITGPEVPIGDQRAAFREVRQLPHHEEFQRIEVWDNAQGRILRKRLCACPGEPEVADDNTADGDESAASLAGQAAGADHSPATTAKKKKST